MELFDAAQTRQVFHDVRSATENAQRMIDAVDRGVMAPVELDGADERFQEPMSDETKAKYAGFASQFIADARDRLEKLLEGRKDVIVAVPATPFPIDPKGTEPVQVDPILSADADPSGGVRP